MPQWGRSPQNRPLNVIVLRPSGGSCVVVVEATTRTEPDNGIQDKVAATFNSILAFI